MAQKFDIFQDDPTALTKYFIREFERGFTEAMNRAQEIVEEEFEILLRDGIDNGFTKALKGVELVVWRKRRYRSIPRSIKIYVPDDTDEIPNIVFHVLNTGRAALGDASEYGLKAWPMSYPRKEIYGNTPMTKPRSPVMQPANSVEPIVFRPTIYSSIAPRNFMKEIYKRAKKRLKEEGYDFIRIELSEQED